MDDPGGTWQFWKFGLQKDDLYHKLNDQYNTILSSIQDPEAFHHDVFEISKEANNVDDFHRLLQDRKQQRLCELNETLETASCEIVANPRLVGTDQWQYALQLFRTRSLDSLVRYFASYLPDKHPWRSADTDAPSFFDAEQIVREPSPISHDLSSHHHHHHHLPPSPRSMTMCSDRSTDTRHDYMTNHLTPARTPSISESESDHMPDYYHLHDDDASQPCDPESPVTTISDISDVASLDVLGDDKDGSHIEASSNQIPRAEAVMPTDEAHDSDLATPKPESRAAPFGDDETARPSPHRRRHRSLSPQPHHSSALQTRPRMPRRDLGSPRIPSRLRRCTAASSPDDCTRRLRGRRQTPTKLKPLPDPIHTRFKGRRIL